jgi:uncharacterized protein YfaS (alpha-2-macroglobulin family)
MEMPPKGEPVALFPAPESVAETSDAPREAGALKVLLTQPEGSVYSVQAINVGFSQPMSADVGKEAACDLIQVTPALKGKCRWLGANTFSFIPAETLSLATDYEVTVPAGTKSLTGGALAKEETFQFSTPGLKVVRYSPSWRSARVPVNGHVLVQFNLPVSIEAVRAVAHIRTALSHKDLAFEVTLAKKDGGGDPIPGRGTAFHFKPKKPLDAGVAYQLDLDAGLVSSEGPISLPAWSMDFKTYGRFATTKIQCGWNRCGPGAPWIVHFTNPVDAKSVRKCIQVSPKVALGRVYAYSSKVTLYPKSKPATRYQLSVRGGCKDQLGNRLTNVHSQTIFVEHYTPRVDVKTGIHFMEMPEKAGGVIPFAKGKRGAIRYPMTLVNTPDVNVRMRRLSEADLAGILPRFHPWSGDDLLTGEWAPQVDRRFGTKLAPDTKKTYGLNLREVLGDDRAGVVFLDVQSDTYDKQRGYDEKRYHKAIIQVTDIGVTMKRSPSNTLVWTTSLATATPRAGVRVAFRHKHGDLMWEGTSDADGLVIGPGMQDFDGSKPRYIIATSGHELSFIDIEDWKFDVEPYRFGVPYEWNAPKVRVLGHVFTERGVYRPGESAHVKGWLRLEEDSELRALPTKQAQVTVEDSQGRVVIDREIQLTQLDGFDLEVPIPKSAALGRWSVSIRPKGDVKAQGEPGGTFRVEAYRAPDFEVTVTAGGEDAIVGGEAKLLVSANYLFGAPMAGADLTWRAVRRERSFAPPGWKNWTFGDNAGRFWWDDRHRDSYEVDGDDTHIGANGTVDIQVDVEHVVGLSGPQELVVEATVEDINRQVVSSSTRIPVHPAAYYVGIRSPGYMVEAGKRFSVGVSAVDPSGDSVDGRTVRVQLQRRIWRSVRKKAAGGGFHWVSEREDKTLTNCVIKTRGDDKTCDFDLRKPGYYTLRAESIDDEGRKSRSSRSLYAYGGGYSWWGNSDDERIDVIPDKKSYALGDTARLLVKSPFRKAQALITTERNGILDQRVMQLEGSANILEVPVTEAMLPNVFISVILIRGRLEDAPDDGTTIDPGKPAFKMGYATITVDRSSKVLSVTIESDKQSYEPGDTVRAKVKVTDHMGKPTAGELTFMAVDEGVLSLTAYQTPDPVKTFFRPRRLGVLTAESRRAILARVDSDDEDGDKGDDGGGGDEGGGESQNYRAAFATTAAFFPALKVGDDGVADVKFKLPDNLTAFRLMAVVASTENRFGSSETRIKVQKPLIIRPALPRFSATGDRFDLRAVVQTVGDHAGKVEVIVEIDGPIEALGELREVVELGPGAIAEVSFPVRVGAPGTATFRFRARALTGFEATDAVEMKIPVKYPSITRRIVETGRVRATRGDEGRVYKQLSLPQNIRSDVGGLTVELSSTGMNDLLPGLQYLVGYPYGCVEQTTGKTLPLVALQLLLEGEDISLPGISRERAFEYAQAGVDRLFTMQTWSGGLAYWPGGDQAHPWGSVYGGLALVQASRLDGMKVDQGKLERLTEYLVTVVNEEEAVPEWYRHGARRNTQAFAAWVLAVAKAPQASAHTRLFEARSELSPFGRALLALAVIEGGGEPSMADTLLTEMLSGAVEDGAGARLAEADGHYPEIMDSDVRANALALMALRRARPDDPLVDKFARTLLRARRSGRWTNTQDNAFAVLSLMDHFHAQEKDTPDFVAMVGVGDQVLGREQFRSRGFDVREIFIPMARLKTLDRKNLGLFRDGAQGALYYTLRLEYAPENPPTTDFDSGFTLRREYFAHDGPKQGEQVTEVNAGDVVRVQLTMVIPADRNYVAIEDPLPAGLELINTTFKTTAPSILDSLRGRERDDWEYWYDSYTFDRIEQHDDRVLLFADYFPAGVYSHSYLARATTVGQFSVPSARVEEMYDPHVFGRTTSFPFAVQ